MSDDREPERRRALGPAGARRLLHALERVPGPSGLLPHAIPGYDVAEHIGAGASGDVFRAFRSGSGREVAIKVLRRPSSDNRRAWRELTLLERVDLACMPRLLDYGTCEGALGGCLYVVTDFVDGLTLVEHCRRVNLDCRGRVRLLADVALAVQRLHDIGIIHRDLKPSNIIVTSESKPMIVDLGIAIDTGDAALETLTGEGVPIGSPAFMSPEQARGDRGLLSTRIDVYALGAVGYYLLTGGTPHDTGTTLHEAVRRVAQDPPREPGELDSSIDRGLAVVLRKAVSHDPSDRYGGASSLAADLCRWLSGEPLEAVPAGAWRRCMRWCARRPVLTTLWLCLVIASVSLTSTVGAIWVLGGRAHRMETDARRSSSSVLMSWAGSPLKEWSAGEKISEGIRGAGLIRRPWGRSIVYVGFANDADHELAGRLAVFRLGDLASPVWEAGTTRAALHAPDGVEDRDDRFVVAWAGHADVFARSGGEEIIALIRASRSGWTTLIVYDAGGETLYQSWHSGHLREARWLRGAGVLVVTGVSDDPSVREGGEDPLPVLFAVRPELGSRGDRLGPGVCEWYRRVGTDRSRAVFALPRFDAPSAEYPSDRFARIYLSSREDRDAAVTLVIDQFGALVRTYRTDAARAGLPEVPLDDVGDR